MATLVLISYQLQSPRTGPLSATFGAVPEAHRRRGRIAVRMSARDTEESLIAQAGFMDFRVAISDGCGLFTRT